MEANQRFTIEEIDPVFGRPTGPLPHARMFVNQCGVIVRDNIPITVEEWFKPKDAGEEASYVSDNAKDDLWTKLIAHFILPPEYEEFEADGTTPVPGGLERRERVKQWALSKMAESFRNYKKKLYQKYVAKGETPKFTKSLERLRGQWPAFVAYKESEKAKARSAKNKINAVKKKYHHKLGTGGYKSAIPKWEKMEADLTASGITPGNDAWPERARHWWYGHGGELDPETGATIFREKILVPSKALIKAMADAQTGAFRPERENDELTRALGTKEKGGRTRGKGADIPWKKGFPEYADSYRSRQRKKDREAALEADRIGRVEAELARMNKVVEALSQNRSSQPQEDNALDNISARKSSVASTELQADDHTLLDDAPVPPRYPVDDVRQLTDCELHQPMHNLSIKVAAGSALSCEPGALHHGVPIPRGYARVTVDELVPGFEELELDIKTKEGCTKLGEVKRQIILWQKKYIRLPGSAPRPPTPRNRPSPPTPLIINRRRHPVSSRRLPGSRRRLRSPWSRRRLPGRRRRLRRPVSRRANERLAAALPSAVLRKVRRR